jgi:hypothetical protein
MITEILSAHSRKVCVQMPTQSAVPFFFWLCDRKKKWERKFSSIRFSHLPLEFQPFSNSVCVLNDFNFPAVRERERKKLSLTLRTHTLKHPQQHPHFSSLYTCVVKLACPRFHFSHENILIPVIC